MPCMKWLLALCFGLHMAGAAGAQQPNFAKGEPAYRVVFSSGGQSASPAGKANIDVFWCYGDDKSYERSLAAAELASSYVTASKIYGARGSMGASNDNPVGEIRVRSMPIDQLKSKVDLRSATGDGIYYAQYDERDINSLLVARSVISAGVVPVKTVKGPLEFSPNIVSVYVCDDGGSFSTSLTKAAQLYIQVMSQSQIGIASKWRDTLQASFGNLRVAEEIEVVGDKSPKVPEIRYFHSADAELASKIAKQLNATTLTDFQPKLVMGYESKVKPGMLEAWMAKN